MVASRCSRSAWLFAVLVLSLSWSLQAEPGAHAELSAQLDSGNLLGPARAEPPFWEALGSLRSGRDNRARLALSVTEAGFLRRVTTHALLRLELGLSGVGEGADAALRDASSSLGLAWQAGVRTRLSLTAYPLDTDYVRLGYLHALDFGGTQASRRESIFLSPRSGAPGFMLRLAHPRFQLFSGLKWASADNAIPGSKRLWGGLGGGSLRIADSLRVDLGFGFFQRQSGFAEGASLRWVWHAGVDEPEVTAEPFRSPSLRDDPERLSAGAARGSALALEGVLLVVRPGSSRAPEERTLVAAPAAALYGSVRGRIWAAHLVLAWRSLPFVLRNDARFAGEQPAARALLQPELTAWLGASLLLPAIRLVPSFEAGLRLPSAQIVPSFLPGVPETWIAGGASGLTPLPIGAPRMPVLATRLSLRWQASAALAAWLAVEYQRDANRVRLATSGTTLTRIFASADSLGLVAGLQARW